MNQLLPYNVELYFTSGVCPNVSNGFVSIEEISWAILGVMGTRYPPEFISEALLLSVQKLKEVMERNIKSGTCFLTVNISLLETMKSCHTITRNRCKQIQAHILSSLGNVAKRCLASAQKAYEAVEKGQYGEAVPSSACWRYTIHYPRVDEWLTQTLYREGNILGRPLSVEIVSKEPEEQRDL